MSMRPQQIGPVLEETKREAQAANPHGNTGMRICEQGVRPLDVFAHFEVLPSLLPPARDDPLA